MKRLLLLDLMCVIMGVIVYQHLTHSQLVIVLLVSVMGALFCIYMAYRCICRAQRRSDD